MCQLPIAELQMERFGLFFFINPKSKSEVGHFHGIVIANTI